jgi:DNA-directed RNA polymerase specialized sigma24 family protein
VAPGLLADVVAPIAYAVKGGDLARDLRWYKSARRDSAEPRQRLAVMLAEFLRSGGDQVWRDASMTRPPDAVAVVPSGQGRPGDHPLLQVVAPATAPLPLIRLSVRPGEAARGRFVRTSWLRVHGRADGRNVLLVDDTWVSGASAQSAAAALKLAGAARVALVVLGRHLDPANPRSADFARKIPGPNALISPFISLRNCVIYRRVMQFSVEMIIRCASFCAMPSPRVVNALLAQSPDSVAELFDAYGEQLFQYCWLMLRKREAALTAVGDTMLAARALIGKLADPEQLAPWLCALARAACKRHEPLPPDMADEPPAQPGDPDAKSKLTAWRSVMRLTPAEREALDLTARHGMSPDDLALVTGRDNVGAAIFLVEAQSRLRDALAAELGFAAPPGVVSISKVYARLPTPEPPAGMRAAVLAASLDPGKVAHVASLVPPLNSAGFPIPPDRSATAPLGTATLVGAAAEEGVATGPEVATGAAAEAARGTGAAAGAAPGTGTSALTGAATGGRTRSGRGRARPARARTSRKSRPSAGAHHSYRRLAVGLASAGLAGTAVYLLWVMGLSGGNTSADPSALPVSGGVSGTAVAGAPAGTVGPGTPSESSRPAGKGAGSKPSAPVLGPLPGGDASGKSVYVTATAPSIATSSGSGATHGANTSTTGSSPSSSSSTPASSSGSTTPSHSTSPSSPPPSSPPPSSPPPSTPPPRSPPPEFPAPDLAAGQPVPDAVRDHHGIGVADRRSEPVNEPDNEPVRELVGDPERESVGEFPGAKLHGHVTPRRGIGSPRHRDGL